MCLGANFYHRLLCRIAIARRVFLDHYCPIRPICVKIYAWTKMSTQKRVVRYSVSFSRGRGSPRWALGQCRGGDWPAPNAGAPRPILGTAMQPHRTRGDGQVAGAPWAVHERLCQAPGAGRFPLAPVSLMHLRRPKAGPRQARQEQEASTRTRSINGCTPAVLPI